MQNNKVFYVYTYFDPRKRGHYCYNDVCFLYEPIYVGKGKNDRCLEHLKYTPTNYKINTYFKTKLRKITSEFSKEEMQKYILIFRTCLAEQEAFNLEKQLIKEIGRSNLKLGPLCNLTDGGDGVSDFSGKIQKKISESLSGQNHPNYGKKLSEETRAKIKEAWVRRKQRAIENGMPLVSEETRQKISENQNRSEESKKRRSESHIGKKLSEETRQKMSIAQSKREVGLKRSEETKRKISLSKSGANHPNYGKQHSVETRAKLKEAWILRKQRALENSEPLISEETGQRISNTQKGRKISETELQKRIGRKTSEDTKIKISKVLKEKYADGNHFNLGRQLTEETRQKISESLKGKPRDEETRRN
jgi:hypothetical protein